MACTSCSSGRGGLPAGCKNNGACNAGGCNKLPVFDWLANMELPNGQAAYDIVEVRFKNSRKEYFKIGEVLGLVVGDAIAVEASPGHDIGMVSMTGELVRLQLKKLGIPSEGPFKAVYRKARPLDMEKWEAAVEKEQTTMMRARAIAVELKLNMKISDVEYQGDSTKAIFYYTAEDRVDFRELIRHLADEFKIRIEMKQIGSRQESSRLGGIGSCGRELCCSTWLRDFRSVNTSAARYQQLSLNPQKLAGQCGKLKCCLNYELDSYLDALKDFPEGTPRLETKKAGAFHQKTDIFKRVMYYSYVDDPGNFIAVPIDRVKLIMELNKNGEKPDVLLSEKEIPKVVKELDYDNVVGQDSLTRFDSEKRKKKKKKKKPGFGQPELLDGGSRYPLADMNPPIQNPNPQRAPQQNRPQRPPQGDRPPQTAPANRPQQPSNPSQRPNTNKRPNHGPRPPKPPQTPEA